MRKLDLSSLDRIPLEDGMSWLPIRRALGLTGVSVNAYRADAAGYTVIETHDERSAGAGGHEELYVIGAGRARFTVGDETEVLGPGEMVAVDAGVERGATAEEDGTTVLVFGGPPGAALPASPFEYWYAAIADRERGDLEAAYATIAAGFEHYPDHPHMHYELGCVRATQGRAGEAMAHLQASLAGDPRMSRWAWEDPDWEGLRERDDFPAKPGTGD